VNANTSASGEQAAVGEPRRGSVREVLGVALKLGLTSFGGPIAHIGYFRAEYVQRRGWVDESTFADLVALAQFLPGAASSKLGIMIGTLRAGLWGGVASWIGFTLPSAIALVVFAYGARSVGPEAAGWLHGLKIVAVAVVAQAVWSMARNLAWDRSRGTIALLAGAATLAFPVTATVQVAVIIVAGFLGLRFLTAGAVEDRPHVAVPIGRTFALVALGLFVALLIALPLLRQAIPGQGIALFDSFFRSGAFVFGGGHVVLPLLQAQVVPSSWISNEQFLAGYGAAQAVPGPLFTFAAYLGAAMSPEPNGIGGAALALAAIFVPSFLLAYVALGSWGMLRSRPGVQATLRGINAGVVGLLLAALYTPVSTSAILRPVDFALALVAFGLLVAWKVPPWLVVLLTAAGGAFVTAFV
jgi:chromate transporter